MVDSRVTPRGRTVHKREDAGAIDAVPLRRTGRTVAGVLALAAAALFVYGAATNSNYQWSTYLSYLFDTRIVAAAWVTVQLTVFSMMLALVLGILLAVMRLSDNAVLR